MNIKFKLTVMSFLQFFVWGSLVNYCWKLLVRNENNGAEQNLELYFSTLGISSIIMPAITGIIADKWLNAERLYGILHVLGGLFIAYLPQVENPSTFYWVIFGAMMCYMPTISLSNSVAYTILKNNDFDVIKVFPPIRVWGTVGFIVAMWITNLTGNKASANMFYIFSCFCSYLRNLFLYIATMSSPKVDG